jgi:hypothetical protein
LKSKLIAKKTSSRITKKKGIKSGGKKNKMKVKRSVSVDTKRATRRKVTSARRPKTLKTIRQTPQRRKTALKKEIVVKRSSGRVEKFDTNRLAQTVSRSGVPFLMARDIAKKATKKIKSQIRSPVREDNHMKKTGKRTISRGRKSSPKPEPVVVTASQVRNLVVNELQDRNRPEIASSYTGYSPEHHDLQAKPTLDDKEPVLDIVAANMNKVLHDPSKRKGSA